MVTAKIMPASATGDHWSESPSGEDRIIIQPALLHGGTIDPANDHRMAMSFAVLGLGIGGVSITGAECVAKSYPGFWDALAGVME